MTLEEFNMLSVEKAKEELFRCCGSTEWVIRLMKHFPFNTIDDLKNNSDRIWLSCSETDWREAFSHHPKIGEKVEAVKKHASTKEWATQEQSGVKEADTSVLSALATANQDYDKKFGFIFIVCATGKSADEMLELIRKRQANDLHSELQIAAQEQNKITHLRIDKLFT